MTTAAHLRALLIFSVLLTSGLRCLSERSETLHPDQIFSRPADDALVEELYEISSLQNEPGRVGVCNPDEDQRQRLFPDLPDYDPEVERVLWCYRFKPDGEVTVLPRAVQVWGAAEEDSLWYFVIPERHVREGTKLLHECGAGPERRRAQEATGQEQSEDRP